MENANEMLLNTQFARMKKRTLSGTWTVLKETEASEKTRTVTEKIIFKRSKLYLRLRNIFVLIIELLKQKWSYVYVYIFTYKVVYK